MEIDRKDFLKIAGGGLLGLAITPFIDKLPKERENPKTEEWLIKKVPVEPLVIEDNEVIGNWLPSETLTYTAPSIEWSNLYLSDANSELILNPAEQEPLIVTFDNQEIHIRKMALRLKEIEDKIWQNGERE